MDVVPAGAEESIEPVVAAAVPEQEEPAQIATASDEVDSPLERLQAEVVELKAREQEHLSQIIRLSKDLESKNVQVVKLEKLLEEKRSVGATMIEYDYPWSEVVDDHGQKFYYNVLTCASAWTVPQKQMPKYHLIDILYILNHAGYKAEAASACSTCKDLWDKDQAFYKQVVNSPMGKLRDTRLIICCKYLQENATSRRRIEQLIRHLGADISQANMYGHTAFMICAARGAMFFGRVLLASGDFDVNQVDHDGNTALHIAVSRGQYMVVKQLLFNSAVNLNAVNACGCTALYVAANRGQLFCSNNDKYEPACTDADFLECIKTLLMHPQVKCDNTNIHGDNALIAACMKGFTSCVEILLKQSDVDVNHGNIVNNTPLILAANLNHIEIVRMLCARTEIDVNISGVDPVAPGATALIDASIRNNCEILEILCSCRDIDLGKPNERGDTALILAAFCGHEKAVATLLRHGTPVNAADPNGATALLVACEEEHVEVVRVLLQLGRDIDVNSMDAMGRTALSIAEAKKNVAIKRLLLGRDVDGEAWIAMADLLFKVAMILFLVMLALQWETIYQALQDLGRRTIAAASFFG